jgi:programmed cell death 8 (apoptosis-inducing factor)
LDPALQTVGVWEKPQGRIFFEISCTESAITDENGNQDYNRGIVYYLKDNRVVGVLLWNVYDQVDTARTLIKRGKQFNNPEELVSLISLEQMHE